MRSSITAAVMLLLTVLTVQAAPSSPGDPSKMIDFRYDRFIEDAARRHRLEANLVRAVIWRESRFNSKAKGLKGEIGLMQIMPGSNYAAADWAKAHNRKLPEEWALLNPKLNIDIGCWYLARALKRYRHYKDAVTLALCEFKDGPRKTASWLPDNRYAAVLPGITVKGTQLYVKDIMKRYYYYRYLEWKKHLKMKGKAI